MKGKDKCRMLKQIRKKIADENDIPYVVEECPYQGECKGTCPKCEAELREMERQLSLRRKIGKNVVLAGVASGIMMSTVACSPKEVVTDIIDCVERVVYGEHTTGDVILKGIVNPVEPISGDVQYIIEEEGSICIDEIEDDNSGLTNGTENGNAGGIE